MPIILTSGTLSAKGDFAHIKRTLGIDKLNPHKIIEISKLLPFDYKKNGIIYISENTPFQIKKTMNIPLLSPMRLNYCYDRCSIA